MPELAEVEFFRRQWAPAHGSRIERVRVHARARIFREVDAEGLARQLEGQRLLGSEAQAKQMLFRFEGGWLGLHLGMAGRLYRSVPELVPDRHDHLVLHTETASLVFSDYRMFGKVQWAEGPEPPGWWTGLPPPLDSEAFTREAMGVFLRRRARAPIKAVLLMQERFPGIGNWMADEILWRARIRPDCPAGRVTGRKLGDLYAAVREVVDDALREIAGRGAERVPQALNERVPEHWLFNHRWRDGGKCPRSGAPLRRETIGGRTTCWSPAWQRWPRDVG
jgi:formamidopyrimidine-DNA glycosylase